MKGVVYRPQFPQHPHRDSPGSWLETLVTIGAVAFAVATLSLVVAAYLG